MLTSVLHYSHRVMVEVDDADPSKLPFVTVRLATDDETYAEALFTADEIRQLADKMDELQARAGSWS